MSADLVSTRPPAARPAVESLARASSTGTEISISATTMGRAICAFMLAPQRSTDLFSVYASEAATQTLVADIRTEPGSRLAVAQRSVRSVGLPGRRRGGCRVRSE